MNYPSAVSQMKLRQCATPATKRQIFSPVRYYLQTTAERERERDLICHRFNSYFHAEKTWLFSVK